MLRKALQAGVFSQVIHKYALDKYKISDKMYFASIMLCLSEKINFTRERALYPLPLFFLTHFLRTV